MSDMQVDLWEDLINSVPAAWQVSHEANLAISRLLLERGRLLADNIEAMARKALATRANHLRLTTPRLIKISEAEAELDSLFASLVEERSQAVMVVEEPAFA
jgi:hypothetical protein